MLYANGQLGDAYSLDRGHHAGWFLRHQNFPLSSASFVGQHSLCSADTDVLIYYASQFKAAQFLRLAETKGNKTLGNTW